VTGLTIGLSTSSPQTSVAIISAAGKLLWSGTELGPQNASAALPKLLAVALEVCDLRLTDAAGYAVDLGPGSFTGVRVGIVFAKVLAYSQGVRVCGATSFDLIAPESAAFVPSRRGEVFVRIPGEAPVKASNPPPGARGYEFGVPGLFPHAAAFAQLLPSLTFVEPELLLPAYFAEPSVSVPKHPFAGRRG